MHKNSATIKSTNSNGKFVRSIESKKQTETWKMKDLIHKSDFMFSTKQKMHRYSSTKCDRMAQNGRKSVLVCVFLNDDNDNVAPIQGLLQCTHIYIYTQIVAKILFCCSDQTH